MDAEEVLEEEAGATVDRLGNRACTSTPHDPGLHTPHDPGLRLARLGRLLHVAGTGACMRINTIFVKVVARHNNVHVLHVHVVHRRLEAEDEDAIAALDRLGATLAGVVEEGAAAA